MKKKTIFTILFSFVIIVSMVSFGFNIYFFATKPISASGIFSICQNSVVEIKAETDDVGASYGTGVIFANDGTIVTNAHVITYKRLGKSYIFDNYIFHSLSEKRWS